MTSSPATCRSKRATQLPNRERLNGILDRHFTLAHRHKLSLVDDNSGQGWVQHRPSAPWIGRLDGTLFTAKNGYEGPGAGVGNNIFSIGTYGQWEWQKGNEAAMRLHTDAWEKWFRDHFPQTERFLYLIDESRDFRTQQQWASWIKNNPGVGRDLMSFATVGMTEAMKSIPALDIAASSAVATFGLPERWDAATARYRNNPGNRVYLYNATRPATGSFATEDDGVALRELPWGQFKKKVDRWFFWEGTYYDNYQGGTGPTSLFQTAFTFGSGQTCSTL